MIASHSMHTLSRITTVFSVLLVLLSITIRLNAQLDPTFGTNGVTQTNISFADSAVGTFLLPNGQIHVVSKSSNQGQPLGVYFLRYNSNGNLDSTYGTGGIKQLTIQNVSALLIIEKAIRQPDGKYLLVGFDGNSGLVARFDENGNIDTTFGNAGYNRPNIDFNGADFVSDAYVYDDGRILIAGTTFNTRLFLVRYMANGVLDKSFNTSGFIYFAETGFLVKKLFRQSNGKFLLFSLGSNAVMVRRFNEDGTFDNTFTNIPYPQNTNDSRNMIVLPDDKIVTAENFLKTVSLERNNDDIRVRKFDANGNVEAGFGTGGLVDVDITTNFRDNLFGLTFQPDGQLIIGSIAFVEPNRSQTEGWQMALARLSSGGVVNGKSLVTDSNFNGRGSIIVQPDGKILSFFERDVDLLLTRMNGIPNQTYRFKGALFDFGKWLGYPQINGIADPTVYRGTNQIWYVYDTQVGVNNFKFGDPTDILVPADYISDLGTELAVFRPSNGTWYIAKDTNFAHQNFLAVRWGQNGDIPVQADYDGDSKSDVAVFRPSNGVWYVRNSSDNSPYIVTWGTNGDQPVTGDYDGDGKDDLAVWRPSDGVWYVLHSSNGQPMYAHFGANGDIPVNADYDGDGKTDFAVWRPSNQVWYILRSTDGFFAAQWGSPGDVPAPADYTGDKKADITVWRGSQGRWYTLRSNDLGLTIFTWGISSDKLAQGRRLY